MAKKTLVIGATTNTARYAYIATNMLLNHGHEVALLGIKKERWLLFLSKMVFQHWKILIQLPCISDHSIRLNIMIIFWACIPNELYLILYRKPEFENLAQSKGIDVEEACTLVLLSTGQY
jgi:hypothetical protein